MFRKTILCDVHLCLCNGVQIGNSLSQNSIPIQFNSYIIFIALSSGIKAATRANKRIGQAWRQPVYRLSLLDQKHLSLLCETAVGLFSQASVMSHTICSKTAVGLV